MRFRGTTSLRKRRTTEDENAANNMYEIDELRYPRTRQFIRYVWCMTTLLRKNDNFILGTDGTVSIRIDTDRPIPTQIELAA